MWKKTTTGKFNTTSLLNIYIKKKISEEVHYIQINVVSLSEGFMGLRVPEVTNQIT